MVRVKVSPKYQVVIPKEVREQAEVKKGARLLVVVKDGVISLLPDLPVSRLRGFVPRVSAGSGREKKDRP